MRVSFRPKQIIGLLVILNILILSLVAYLLLEIKKNEVLSFAVDVTSLALPLLAEDIKRIDVSSRAYIIYDPQARTVVSGKNEKLRFSPASSTKIMTAIIALEEYNLEDVITATGLDKVKGSTMKLREGETISVENVLYGLLLPSGNDAAYIIASVYEWGESGFVV